MKRNESLYIIGVLVDGKTIESLRVIASSFTEAEKLAKQTYEGYYSVGFIDRYSIVNLIRLEDIKCAD